MPCLRPNIFKLNSSPCFLAIQQKNQLGEKLKKQFKGYKIKICFKRNTFLNIHFHHLRHISDQNKDIFLKNY